MIRLLADMTQERIEVLELAGMPAGWLRLLALGVLVSACFVVFWLYRREARVGAGVGLRMSLATVRCLVLLVLAGVWLEPTLATYTRQTLRANVAVLVDVSGSMAVPEPTGGDGAAVVDRARIDLVADVLRARDHEWLRRLANRNQLRLYAFGRETRPVRIPFSEDPNGPVASGPAAAAPAALDEALRRSEPYTDLGQAMTSVLADCGDAPLAGVVVFSDGILTRGLGAEDVAALAERYRAPIFAVGVGLESEPPNLRVTAVSAPAATPLGDPIELRVELASNGPDNVPVEVEITQQRIDSAKGPSAAGEERSLGTRTVALGGAESTGEVRLRVPADVAGEYRFRATARPLPDEPVVFDNTRATTVHVVDDKLRVLLVSGRPSYDYRFIARLLEREKSLDVSAWLQSADETAVRDGDTTITSLPRKPEELFEYDVILLLDPDPREFDAAWAVAARRLVDEFGGGLLLAAGPHFTARFLNDPRLEDLSAMLPFTPDPDAEVRLNEQGAFRLTAQQIEMPEHVAAHPLVSFFPDDAMNRSIWRSLPGVFWYLPVLREKPLAMVLLRMGAGRGGQAGPPLLAVQPFGAGRVAMLTFDSTARWRSTGERYFNRFWIQATRYLAQGRRQGGSKRGRIVLDRDVVNVGDMIKVEALVLDESFVPWHASEVEAALEPEDAAAQSVTLTPAPEREGWYVGRFVVDRAGTATFRVPLPGGASSERDSLARQVLVQQPDVELRSLRQRSEELQKLAQRTGGRYYRIGEAGRVPDDVEDATVVRPPIPGPRTALWDNAWILSALTVLLGVEWALRRRNYLL